MNRRGVIKHLSAGGLLAAVPFGSWGAVPAGRVTLLTDQPRLPPELAMPVFWVVRIPTGRWLAPDWHAGCVVRSLRATLGPVNALLLMESLRDLRAHVHVVQRMGEVEWIDATLPA